MLREVFQFFINCFLGVVNCLKMLLLDEQGHITLYDFFIFMMIASIMIHIISFIKHKVELYKGAKK